MVQQTTTPPLAPINSVLGQIERQVSDWRTRLAMSFGAGIEGGNLYTGPWGVGDQGHSFGPFQINLPYHPTMSQATATNPHDAVAYMLASYQGAVAAIPASLWKSNPELAAEQATRAAENPAQDYYTARGTSQVDAAYRQAVAGLGGFLSPAIRAAGGAGAGAAGFVTNPPGAGGNGANAPYDPATLHAPLTQQVKDTIIAWLDYLGLPGKQHVSGLPNDAALKKLPDAQLLDAYKAAYLITPGVTITTPSIGQAVSDAIGGAIDSVKKPLTKAALIIAGLGIIVVALVMLSKSDDGAGASSSSFGNGGGAAQRATRGRASEVDEAAVAE